MKKILLWLCLLFCTGTAFAHPMPNSIANLSVLQSSIRGEAQIPLIELATAVGGERIKNLHHPFFKTYFTEHIKAVSNGTAWVTQIESISTSTSSNPLVGTYQEAVVTFTLTPPDAALLRTFAFHYNAVMRQVITHSALVYVKQDWSNGIQEEEQAQQVGVVQLDVPSGNVFPLQVNLQEGSWQKGFGSMFKLGMRHIGEGTDHLLFLIVLLLPATLLVHGGRWNGFGGVRYGAVRLLKIVTAFTIGHSLTLLAGAAGWLRLPAQPVEILIAVSILVSAVHAVRPLFPGKEAAVAAGFGLVHGLAFSGVLANLGLNAGRLAVSILGFNLGIEVMQLFVIALVVPWLMLLSKTPAYKWVRITGAVLAGVAALAWIAERVSGQGNLITGLAEKAAAIWIWMVAALALLSLVMYATAASGKKKAVRVMK